MVFSFRRCESSREAGGFKKRRRQKEEVVSPLLALEAGHGRGQFACVVVQPQTLRADLI